MLPRGFIPIPEILVTDNDQDSDDDRNKHHGEWWGKVHS